MLLDSFILIAASPAYWYIIAGTIVIILSYFFMVLAQKTNIPAVLMLILTGIGIKYGIDALGLTELDYMPALELLGITGLIMIVLEAALDLKITKEKIPLILKSLAIALICLIASAFAIGGIIAGLMEMPFMVALLYATPLSILSSAIIIPSVGHLIDAKKEFLVYESTFSDILGIMLFYFLIGLGEDGGKTATLSFFGSFALTLIISVAVSYALIFVFKQLKGHVRLFLLIAVLLMLYAIGKLFGLSPLLMILIFGIILANHHFFFKFFNNDWIDFDAIKKIESDLHLITLETAFAVRTFFFVVFGMTIVLSSLIDLNVFLSSMAIVAAIYVVRFISLKVFFLKKSILPELFIAPRGLITILLFFSIPKAVSDNWEASFDEGILLYVILVSSIVMTISLIVNGKRKPIEDGGGNENHETNDEAGENAVEGDESFTPTPMLPRE